MPERCLELINYDYNSFIGRWPFSKSRQASFEDLKAIHEKHDISGGFVSSLDSVLYNDPMEGNLELAKILDGTDYETVPSLNPMLPNIHRDFDMADRNFKYRAVRIFPSLHGYDYDSPKLIEFMNVAKEYDKAVFIHQTFGDARLGYLLKQKPADIEKVKLLAQKSNGTKIVLCNIRLNEILQIQELIRSNVDIYFDMSELKHSMFAIKELEDIGLTDKIVFGSFYPMFDFTGAYIHFKGIDEKRINGILNRNIFKRGS